MEVFYRTLQNRVHGYQLSSAKSHKKSGHKRAQACLGKGLALFPVVDCPGTAAQGIIRR